MGKFGRKKNHTGRNDGERFVMLPHYALDSLAFRELSGRALKVLVYMVRRYYGSNNGKIGFGVRSGCFVRINGKHQELSIGMSKSNIARALAELERAGIIVCVTPASFDQKRLVKEWRITYLGNPGEIPTKDFMKF